MKFIYDDGGRKDAGYKGTTGDCSVRSIVIATGLPYKDVYVTLNTMGLSEHIGKRKKSKSNSRTGVYKNTFKKFMLGLGWTWTPTMFIGQGCKVHVKANELPSGKIIVVLSKHFAAVVDGVLHDIYDCSRNETRCVYGYYSKN